MGTCREHHMNTYNHYLKQSICVGNDVASLGWLLTSHNKNLIPSETILWHAIEKNRAVVVTEWARLFPEMFSALSVQKIFDTVVSYEMAFAVAQAPVDWEEDVDDNGIVSALGDVWVERFPFLEEELTHQRLPADIVEEARKRYEEISARLAPLEQTVLGAEASEDTTERPKPALAQLPLDEIEDHSEFLNTFKRTET